MDLRGFINILTEASKLEMETYNPITQKVGPDVDTKILRRILFASGRCVTC